MAKVKLDDIIEHLEFSNENGNSFLNKINGEVYFITQEELSYAEEGIDDKDYIPDWQKENIEIAKEIIETDNYIRIPDKYEINEYEIMERFCLSIENKEISDKIFYSLKGRGAFGRFKDNIFRFGIEKDWYEYKERGLKELAIDWCKRNNIEYTDEKSVEL